MNKISLIVTIFILFSIYHNSSTLESRKCECDIFQLSKHFSGKHELTNFTKQSGEINGRPFYFSITDDPKKTLKHNSINKIVWWNATASSWMIQTYDTGLATTISEVNIDKNCPKFSTTEDWKLLPERTNGVIKSRNLKDENKCQVKSGEFDTKFSSTCYNGRSKVFYTGTGTHNIK